jgi:hypothetical protein
MPIRQVTSPSQRAKRKFRRWDVEGEALDIAKSGNLLSLKLDGSLGARHVAGPVDETVRAVHERPLNLLSIADPLALDSQWSAAPGDCVRLEPRLCDPPDSLHVARDAVAVLENGGIVERYGSPFNRAGVEDEHITGVSDDVQIPLVEPEHGATVPAGLYYARRKRDLYKP